jgi:hypothetical protein
LHLDAHWTIVVDSPIGSGMDLHVMQIPARFANSPDVKKDLPQLLRQALGALCSGEWAGSD